MQGISPLMYAHSKQSFHGDGQGERQALVHSSGALRFDFVIGLLPSVFMDLCSWLSGAPASALECLP